MEMSVLLSQPKTCSQPGSNNHSQTIPRKTAVSCSVVQEEFNQKRRHEKPHFSALKLFCFRRDNKIKNEKKFRVMKNEK